MSTLDFESRLNRSSEAGISPVTPSRKTPEQNKIQRLEDPLLEVINGKGRIRFFKKILNYLPKSSLRLITAGGVIGLLALSSGIIPHPSQADTQDPFSQWETTELDRNPEDISSFTLVNDTQKNLLNAYFLVGTVNSNTKNYFVNRSTVTLNVVNPPVQTSPTGLGQYASSIGGMGQIVNVGTYVNRQTDLELSTNFGQTYEGFQFSDNNPLTDLIDFPGTPYIAVNAKGLQIFDAVAKSSYQITTTQRADFRVLTIDPNLKSTIMYSRGNEFTQGNLGVIRETIQFPNQVLSRDSYLPNSYVGGYTFITDSSGIDSKILINDQGAQRLILLDRISHQQISSYTYNSLVNNLQGQGCVPDTFNLNSIVYISSSDRVILGGECSFPDHIGRAVLALIANPTGSNLNLIDDKLITSNQSGIQFENSMQITTFNNTTYLLSNINGLGMVVASKLDQPQMVINELKIPNTPSPTATPTPTVIVPTSTPVSTPHQSIMLPSIHR